MSLAKITRGNQVTIPKAIAKLARLSQSSCYVQITYENGLICLKPVSVEEQIDPAQFEKFQAWALKDEKGDATFGSLDEGIRHLKKRAGKSDAA